MFRRLSYKRAGTILAVAVALGAATCSTSTQNSAVAPAPLPGHGTGQATPFLNANLTGISCTTAARCVTVGIATDPAQTFAPSAVSSDGGLSWKPLASSLSASVKFLNVSCSLRNCLAVGATAYGPLFYGAQMTTLKWTLSSGAPKGAQAQVAGCSGKTLCLGIFADATHVWAASTTDAGMTWTTGGTLPAGTGLIRTLSCDSATNCIAAGTTSTGGPLLVVTNDGGTTWAAASLPTTPAVTAVLSASCTSSTCLAVAVTNVTGASTLLTSSDGGVTFAAFSPTPGTPSTVANPLAITCESTSCVVVGTSSAGSAQAAQLTAAQSVKDFNLSYAPNPLNAVSCSSNTRCVALSAANLVVLTPLVAKSSEQQAR